MKNVTLSKEIKLSERIQLVYPYVAHNEETLS